MPGIYLKAKASTELVRRNLENLRLALPKVGKFRLTEAGSEIRRRMSKPGKKIRYPVRWANKRQMIKVIIMLRKRGTLPYIRTHAHERGWKEETTTTGIKVYNNVRASRYLYGTMKGERQSSIHVDRWLLLRAVYDAVIKDLPKKVIESLRQLPR